MTPTTDMLLDRGMMGDGVIDLKETRELVESAGYVGMTEVEIFSKDVWWKAPPDEVLEVLCRPVASRLLNDQRCSRTTNCR